MRESGNYSRQVLRVNDSSSSRQRLVIMQAKVSVSVRINHGTVSAGRDRWSPPVKREHSSFTHSNTQLHRKRLNRLVHISTGRSLVVETNYLFDLFFRASIPHASKQNSTCV